MEGQLEALIVIACVVGCAGFREFVFGVVHGGIEGRMFMQMLMRFWQRCRKFV